MGGAVPPPATNQIMEPCIKNHRHKWRWTNNTSDGIQCFYCTRCNQQLNKIKNVPQEPPARDEWFFKPEPRVNVDSRYFWGIPHYSFSTSYTDREGMTASTAIADGAALVSHPHTTPETYDNTIGSVPLGEAFRQYEEAVRQQEVRVMDTRRRQEEMIGRIQRVYELDLDHRINAQAW